MAPDVPDLLGNLANLFYLFIWRLLKLVLSLMYKLKNGDMKTLEAVQTILDSIDCINYGGCGISALAMFRWLQKNDMLAGDESFTYLYVGWDYTFAENESILKENSKNKLLAASHIMLRHNGKLIDSEGSTVQSKYVNRHENISLDTLMESINFSGWNSMFDREESIPIIERKLKIELSDVTI